MKKILAIILLLLSIMCVLLCTGCGKEPDVSLADKNIYIVYREDEVDQVLDAISMAKSFVEDTLDITCKRITDPQKSDGINISIGHTSCPESEQVRENLLYNDYTICIKNGIIVIEGGSNQAIVDAVAYFSEHYADVLKSGVFTADDNYIYHANYPVENATMLGTNLSEYKIIYPDCTGTYSEKATLERYAARKMRDYFIDQCGIELETVSDATEESKYEILIGQTNRNTDFVENNKPDKYGYIVKNEGGKLNVVAGGLWGYTKACELFNTYIDGTKLSVPKSIDETNSTGMAASTFVFEYIKDDKCDTIPISKLTLGGVDISEYQIVYHDYTAEKDEDGNDYNSFGLSEITAANEMAKYIECATGVKLKVVDDTQKATDHEIVIGATNRPRKNDDKITTVDDFIIEAVDGNLYIYGGYKRGTLYGVYSFLEEYLGVRYFASDCEIIYKLDEIDIPSDLYDYQCSDLEYRDIDAFDSLSAPIAAKLKINSYFQREIPYEYGGSYSFVGGSNAFVHTMSSLFGIADADTQPCLTDPDILDKAIKVAKGYLARYKDTEILNLSQNDNNNYCTCANCTAVNREEGSNAGTLIRFVNAVADAIKDEYPDVKIMTLAYMFSQDAPKTAPRDNVIIELCNYDTCLSHKIGSCSENTQFEKQLTGWSSLTTNNNLFFWYYVSNFTHRTEDTPIMNLDVLYDNFQVLRANGLRGFFGEALPHKNTGDFDQLRTYAVSKLMWDPDMTREEYNACINEFLHAFYGEGSDIVYEYYYYLRSISGTGHFSLYTSPPSMFDEYEFRLVSDELGIWLDVAKNMTTDKACKRHVEQVISGFTFVKKELIG